MNDNNASEQNLAGLILAAGGSSRLGQPKQLVEFQGETLLRRVINTAAQHCSADVVVVTGANADVVEAEIAAVSRSADLCAAVHTVRNDQWAQGMAGSIAAGVAAFADTDCAGLLIMVCDQPLVTPAEIARLVHVWQKSPTSPVAAGYDGNTGVPAIFPAACIPDLVNLSGDSGAKALLQASPELKIVDMPTASFDIDTEQDLGDLRSM